MIDLLKLQWLLPFDLHVILHFMLHWCYMQSVNRVTTYTDCVISHCLSMRKQSLHHGGINCVISLCEIIMKEMATKKYGKRYIRVREV